MINKNNLTFGSILLCTLIWSIYGVIFYPGLISWDFYVQWHEMSGKIQLTDWHPFFHTLVIWLLTRIWYSPAMIMTAQILSMAILVGAAVQILQKTGASKWAVVAAVLFYAFFPLNGFYAVSLWKDIGYSIAFFWMNILVVNFYLSNGKYIENFIGFTMFLAALCCVSMMRHNGIAVAGGTVFSLFIFRYNLRKARIVVLSLFLFAVFFIVKYPLAAYLNVDFTSKNILKSQLVIQHIGSILNNSKHVSLENEDKVFLSNLIPIFLWKKFYNPLSCMPLAFSKDKKGNPIFKSDILKEEKKYKELLTIWIKMIIRHPTAILYYYTQATELIWRIKSPYKTFVIPSDGLTENDLYYGYKSSHSSNKKYEVIGGYLVEILGNPSSGWFLHRGAIYFWLSIFLLFFIILRSRNKHVLLIAMPMLLQTATVAAFPLVQDTRFMFPIILVFPVFFALFFSPPLRFPVAE